MTTIAKNATIHFPLEAVGEKIRDFNALPMNHPAVASSHIEDNLPSDQIGCIRSFNLKQGGTFRERLVTLDHHQHICVYQILESPMPFQSYSATIRLQRIADSNSTSMEWSAQFDCDRDQEVALKTWVGDVFEDGFNCLRELLVR